MPCLNFSPFNLGFPVFPISPRQQLASGYQVKAAFLISRRAAGMALSGWMAGVGGGQPGLRLGRADTGGAVYMCSSREIPSVSKEEAVPG
jgi:hypothetical protein